MSAALDAIDARLKAATPGPWGWRGNMDHEDPLLVGSNRIGEDGKRLFPGAIEVLWSYPRERRVDDAEADSHREYLRDVSIEQGGGGWRSYTEEEIEEHVREDWLTDQWGDPVRDRRMCFTSSHATALDARELAVFEVGRARGLPDDTPRSDPRIYRADIVDVRHPDADLIAHAPTDIAALIAVARAAEQQADVYEHFRTCEEEGEGDCCLEAGHQAYLALAASLASLPDAVKP